jgi:S-formylglutathione hydrolase FrmB
VLLYRKRWRYSSYPCFPCNPWFILFDGLGRELPAVYFSRLICILVVFGLPWQAASATGWRKESDDLIQINKKLRGQVIDHTANHGKDRRLWSPALGQRRDVYVYLPPGFDPQLKYPLVIWLHGFAQDERSFLREVAPRLDACICAGLLPPMIVVAPDGSLEGEPCHAKPGSFFINSKVGAFEDYVLKDVLGFVLANYPVRPEREAHVLAGLSMGGFGAYTLAIKHRELFGVVVGIYPPLNLRWVDDKGRYFSKFDPNSWGWRTRVTSRHEVIAKFYGGLVTFTIGQVIEPIFGRSEQGLQEVIKHNPIEMIDSYGLKPGELEMYVGYGKKDEFNLAAQIESFLYVAKQRGLNVTVSVDPEGHHDLETAVKLLPGIVEWLGPRLAPYGPVGHVGSVPIEGQAIENVPHRGCAADSRWSCAETGKQDKTR